MKVHLRFDDSNPGYTRLTIFLNGGNCGQLTMRTDEAASFHRILAGGCESSVDSFMSIGKIHDDH